MPNLLLIRIMILGSLALPAVAAEEGNGACMRWQGMKTISPPLKGSFAVEAGIRNSEGCETSEYTCELKYLNSGQSVATVLPSHIGTAGLKRLRWILNPGVYNLRIRSENGLLVDRTFSVGVRGEIGQGWGEPVISEPTVTWEPALSILGAYSYRKVSNEELNPGNAISEVPSQVATFDFRPQLKARGKTWKVTARPRFIANRNHVKIDGRDSEAKWKSKVVWSEGFGTLDMADNLSVSYGLQNYQWGPAESASPSNLIFRETAQQRDILFETRGKHLFRVNYTPLPEWSEVLILEPSGNGESEYEFGEPYARKALLKSEYSWDGGASYAGLVLGWREAFGNWLGEYGNLEILQGLSIYADASHHKKTFAYYPIRDPGGRGIVLAQSGESDKNYYHFAAAGGRYIFENGNDLRFELIYQNAGYDTAEMQLAASAITSRQPAQLSLLSGNLQRANQNGLEFPGQQYAFASARFPDFWKVRDLTLYLRLLYSIQDTSKVFYVSSEKAMGDSGNLFGNLSINSGSLVSELKGLVPWALTLGYRHSW